MLPEPPMHRLIAEDVSLEGAVPAGLGEADLLDIHRLLHLSRAFDDQAFKLVRRGVAPVLGAGKQELSAIYITDLTDALARVATSEIAIGRTYCACHPEIFTNLDLARGIARSMGREARIIRLPGAATRTTSAVGIVSRQTAK